MGLSHEVLVGRGADRFPRALDLLLACGLLLATFAAYAVGLFEVSGGVIVVPEDATLVGAVAAAGAGLRRRGLLVAWALPFAAYLGFRADWALLGLSGHSLGGALSVLLDPVGVAVSGVAAVVVGTLGFAIGHAFRACLGVLGRERTAGEG